MSLIAFMTVPAIAFAAAGFADRFNDFRHWIYQAYLYNLEFGIGFLIVFTIVYYLLKKKLDPIILQFRQYLQSHPALAIIVCGALIAVPFGIYIQISWYILLFISLGLNLFCIAALTVLLAYSTFRNKVLLSPLLMKAIMLFILSALCASLLFMILTYSGALQLDCTFYTIREGVSNHQIDSLVNIWCGVLISLCIIPFSLLLHGVGSAFRWIKRKITQLTTPNSLS